MKKHDKVKTSDKAKFGVGFLVAGAVTGIAATALAIFKQKKREQVYHEAEIRAMDELDDLLAEDNSACDCCECSNECSPEKNCVSETQMTIAEQEQESIEEVQEEPKEEIQEDKKEITEE